jgi:hypothetical protein
MSSAPRSWASIPNDSGSRCTRATTRRRRSGSTRSGSRRSGCSDAIATTSGRWGWPGPPDSRPSCSTTGAPHMGRPAARSSTKSASWSSGTSYSCSTSRTSPITWSETFRRSPSTPVPAWSGSPSSPRESRTSSPPTWCRPCSPPANAPPECGTAPRVPPMSACASSPITGGRSPSSSPTGWCPPTRAAATCSAGCCAAPFATPGSSVPSAP